MKNLISVRTNQHKGSAWGGKIIHQGNRADPERRNEKTKNYILPRHQNGGGGEGNLIPGQVPL